MKIIKKAFTIAAVIVLLTLGGCYQNVVDSLNHYTLQIPITIDMVNFGNSNESRTEDNLNDYEEYRENRNRINRIELYQFSFHAKEVFPEEAMDTHFDRMTFYIETAGKRYKIGEITDVTVAELYKKPYLGEVKTEDMTAISRGLLKYPAFATIAVYETSEGKYFERVASTLVVAIRVDVDLLENAD